MLWLQRGLASDSLRSGAGYQVPPALIIDPTIPRQGVAIERLIFIGFLLGLALCPFWIGSNTLGAWGVNAVYFSALLVMYELSLLAKGKSHPFPISWIKIPVICFALVAVWCVIQMSPYVPKSW